MIAAAALLLAVVVAGFYGCGGPQGLYPEEELLPRPGEFGLNLPYPISYPSFDFYTPPLDGRPQLELINAILYVDGYGFVRSVNVDTPEDSAHVTPFLYALERMRFAPGLKNLQPVDMQLPITLLAGDTAGPPQVFYPVNEFRAITDPFLYYRAIELNGVDLGGILNFPSYYYKTDRKDYSILYPYRLFRVFLDVSGEVEDVQFVKGSSDTFVDQFRSAIRWGEYRPMLIDGQPQPTALFLNISLFRQVNYPTIPVTLDDLDELPLMDRLRVVTTPDTIGLMQVPVPWAEWSGEIEDNNWRGYLSDTITARIKVDSTGWSHVTEVSGESWKPVAILGKRAFSIRFYPARDWAGNPVPFEGIVYMEYESESNVRVWFSWLPESQTIY
jgi:hypothetical protein